MVSFDHAVLRYKTSKAVIRKNEIVTNEISSQSPSMSKIKIPSTSVSKITSSPCAA